MITRRLFQHTKFPAVLALFVYLAFGSLPVVAGTVHTFQDNFLTRANLDMAWTTADVDTVAGEIRMFPHVDSVRGTASAAGTGFRVVVDDAHAFVSDFGFGLRIMDISDPDNPTLVGNFATGGWALGVDVDGDIAYVTSNLTVAVVDVSDVTNPSLIGSYTTANSALDIVVDGNCAYVANSDSLTVFDVSTPTAPLRIGAVFTPGTATSLFLDGRVVYVASDVAGLHAVSINDRTAPVILDTYDTPGEALDVTVWGNYAYVGDGIGGVQIIDITDPSALVFGGSYSATGSINGIDVDGNYAVFASDAGHVGILDITDPTAPIADGTVTTAGMVYGLDLYGEFTYVVGDPGLQVLDLFSPSHAGYYGVDLSYGVAVSVQGDIAYVVSGDDLFRGARQLTAYDISSLDYPPQLAVLTFETPTEDHSIEIDIRGNLAFVVAEGFYVIDISDPSALAVVGIDPATSGNDVEVAGNYAFVVRDGANHFQVVDVSKPALPHQVTSLTLSGDALSLTLEGDHAYVGGTVVTTVDISDPTSPVNINENILTGGSALDIEARGNRAFIGRESDIIIYDTTDPTNPVFDEVVSWAPGGYSVLDLNGNQLVHAGDIGLYGSLITTPGASTPVEGWTYHLGVGNVRSLDATLDFIVSTASSILWIHRSRQRIANFYDNKIVSGSIDTNGPAIRFAMSASSSSYEAWYSITDSYHSHIIYPMPSDGNWSDEISPTESFRWRGELIETQPYILSSTSQVGLKWLFQNAAIDSIVDVPHDQGGWVYLYFTRSGYDFASGDSDPIQAYNVHRRIDTAFANTVQKAGSLDHETGLYDYEDEKYRINDGVTSSAPAGAWAVVATVFAQGIDQYVALVPTSGDSATTIPYTECYVSAHTATPTVFFDSAADSGYSTDNIAPAVPTNFAVAYNTGSGNSLSWDVAPEPDFQYFRVYRSPDPVFTPTVANLVHSATSPGWLDPEHDGGGVYYIITATDFSGNESEAAEAGSVSAVPGQDVPDRWALTGNNPNPFNPQTQIVYNVPASGGLVALRVYNLRGELIKTLVEGSVEPGVNTVTWDGRNTDGRAVASGVYFYRLTTDGYDRTRKMVLSK